MTLTNAIARYSCSANATHTKTNVSSSSLVGTPSVSKTEFSTADICYSFKIAANASSDVATLTLSSGAVAQTTGTPVLTDHAEDFEGAALGTAVRIYSVCIECITAGAITVAGSAGLGAVMEVVGDALLWVNATGDTDMGTVTFTFADGTGDVEVTVIGKTS